MQSQDSFKVIQKFLRRIRFFWQNIFLIGVLIFAVTFYHQLQTHTVLKPIPYLMILNWISFIVAMTLAIYIFILKRKYFNLRFYNTILKGLLAQSTDLTESQLARQFTRQMEKKMKLVWWLALALILVGVIYYWVTFDDRNLHVYFVVGLYSLAINYPRRDLLNKVPYLIEELYPETGESK